MDLQKVKALSIIELNHIHWKTKLTQSPLEVFPGLCQECQLCSSFLDPSILHDPENQKSKIILNPIHLYYTVLPSWPIPKGKINQGYMGDHVP